MEAIVKVRVGDSEERALRPGDVIGRGVHATLTLADPWLSEAHAMVSLRDGVLKLLGLRGRFAVRRANLTEVALKPEMVIHLSSRTRLAVVDVRLPTRFLALKHPALGLCVLSGVMSLVGDGHPRLARGARVGARAIFWTDGEAWFARRGEGEDLPIEGGSVVKIDGLELPVVDVEVDAAGEVTEAGPSRLDHPLVIVARYDTVHIHRDDAPSLVLDGIIARIVSDLAVAGVPIGWQELAAEIWANEDDPAVLRRNWDATLSRLRRKLRGADIRSNLIRPDYSGNFELFLKLGDRVEDQT